MHFSQALFWVLSFSNLASSVTVACVPITQVSISTVTVTNCPNTCNSFLTSRSSGTSSTPNASHSSSSSSSNSPATTRLICYEDNCLREQQDPRFSSMASAFCSTYTTRINTNPSAIPAYLENCSRSPSQVSSACSCLMSVAASTTTRSSLTTTTSSSVSLATTRLICYEDNCLREQQDPRFSSMASAFCSTYTTRINTNPSAIPAYLENCSRSPSQVSSACSCLMSVTSSTTTRSSSSTSSSLPVITTTSSSSTTSSLPVISTTSSSTPSSTSSSSSSTSGAIISTSSTTSVSPTLATSSTTSASPTVSACVAVDPTYALRAGVVSGVNYPAGQYATINDGALAINTQERLAPNIFVNTAGNLQYMSTVAYVVLSSPTSINRQNLNFEALTRLPAEHGTPLSCTVGNDGAISCQVLTTSVYFEVGQQGGFVNVVTTKDTTSLYPIPVYQIIVDPGVICVTPTISMG